MMQYKLAMQRGIQMELPFRLHADQVEAITFGKKGHLFEVARPWRSAMIEAMTPELVVCRAARP
jgi:hypothetical protein